MAYRFRAKMRFTQESGLATWARDQNVVRLGQSFHMNEGALSEELSKHSAVDGVYTADFFFSDDDEALAVDTYNTMTAPSVLSSLLPMSDEEASFVDVHKCNHDVGGPCEEPYLSWTQVSSGGVNEWAQPQPGVPHPDHPYLLGAMVTYNGQTWESTHDGENVWEPGSFGWVVV